MCKQGPAKRSSGSLAGRLCSAALRWHRAWDASPARLISFPAPQGCPAFVWNFPGDPGHILFGSNAGDGGPGEPPTRRIPPKMGGRENWRQGRAAKEAACFQGLHPPTPCAGHHLPTRKEGGRWGTNPPTSPAPFPSPLSGNPSIPLSQDQPMLP